MLKILIVVIILLLIVFFYPVKISYSAPPVVEPVVKATIKEYAKQRVIEVFGSGWLEFERIIAKESHNWTVYDAHYPKSKLSTAWGLAGFLDSTWKTVDCVKTSDPYIQIDCGIKYVKARYQTPQKALAFHNKIGWY